MCHMRIKWLMGVIMSWPVWPAHTVVTDMLIFQLLAYYSLYSQLIARPFDSEGDFHWVLEGGLFVCFVFLVVLPRNSSDQNESIYSLWRHACMLMHHNILGNIFFIMLSDSTFEYCFILCSFLTRTRMFGWKQFPPSGGRCFRFNG